MSHEEFCSLKAFEDHSVQLTFIDGESVRAMLVSITVDLDQRRHLVYDLATEQSDTFGSKISYYASGEELLSCVPLP